MILATYTASLVESGDTLVLELGYLLVGQGYVISHSNDRSHKGVFGLKFGYS